MPRKRNSWIPECIQGNDKISRQLNIDPLRLDSSQYSESDRLELLRFEYEQALKLVCHEDSLNWHKFYSFLYVNVGFAAALAFAFRVPDRPIALAFTAGLSLIAMALSYFSWNTMLSARKCLGGHKDAATHIEGLLSKPRAEMNMPSTGATSSKNQAQAEEPLSVCSPGGCEILCNAESPDRAILTVSPFLAMIGWGVLLAGSIWLIACWVRCSDPNDDPDSIACKCVDAMYPITRQRPSPPQ